MLTRYFAVAVLGIILFASIAQASDIHALKYALFFSEARSDDARLLLEDVPALNQHPNAPQTRDAKPFLKSLLIPGWGQYSQERFKKAAAFIGLELAFWGGMYGVKTYGEWLENDYKAYAALHACIDPGGKNHDFFVDIGNYNSIDDYNQTQQLERDYNSLYLSEGYYWQWDSSTNRNTFEDIRIKSDGYKNSVIYFAGAIVLNHLVAAIDAARHSKIQDKLSAGIKSNPQGNVMLFTISFNSGLFYPDPDEPKLRKSESK